MLEIVVDNGLLDLPLGIEFSMVIENPFVAEGRIPLPYSTSFELPPTVNNLKAFNWPNRLGTYSSSTSSQREKTCSIRFNGLNIAQGKLVMINFDKNIKVNFSGVDFNENHKAPIYTADLGSDIIPGSFTSVGWSTTSNYAYNYRNWASFKTHGIDNRFVIAPIGRASSSEPFKWADRVRREGSDAGLYRNMKRTLQDYYYNPFNVTTKEFYFTSSSSTYHAEIFPQFRVHYILSQLIGKSLQNNPFSVGRLRDLVVPTYFFTKYLNVIGSSPMVSNIFGNSNLPSSQPIINFEDYFPNIGANVFIKEVLNLFAFTLYSYQGGYNIDTNTDILNKPVKINWSDYLIDEPLISLEEGKFYEYGFQTDRPKYTPENTPITVNTITDMVRQAVTLDANGLYEAIFFISQTNQYFSKVAYEESYRITNDLIKELIVDYDFLGYGGTVDPEDNDKTKFSVKVNINTPPLHPFVYIDSLENTSGEKRYIEVPRHAGRDTNSPSRAESSRKRDDYFEIMLYDGLKRVSTPSSSTMEYPFLNPYGNAEVPLTWQGNNSLISKFHQPYKSWIERDKLKLQAKFLLNPITLHQINITDKIHVNGRNFFIEKLLFTLTSDEISPVEANLIEV